MGMPVSMQRKIVHIVCNHDPTFEDTPLQVVVIGRTRPADFCDGDRIDTGPAKSIRDRGGNVFIQ